MAEREGFEPSIQVTQYAEFRVRCIQPLCHLSAFNLILMPNLASAVRFTHLTCTSSWHPRRIYQLQLVIHA